MPTLVPVNTPSAHYHVAIGHGLLREAATLLAPLQLGKKVAVIADANVTPIHSPALLTSLQQAGYETAFYEVRPGETTKDLSVFAQILSFLAQKRFDRQSTVISLGGGVVGDLGGFVAASFLRGVHFVQIPTTLLSMVDSSVGGKTGVNLPEGKNLVGAFYQPRIVLADLDTLKTLPPRELAAGMAEVIKHGIIADAALFDHVAQGTPSDWEQVVRRNVEIKAAVVAADEHETSGKRAQLNFGHTVGHAIETVAGYGQYLHGEGVAIGMRAAAHLSNIVLGLPAADVRRIEDAIAANHLPLHFPNAPREKLLDVMSRDKKVRAGNINWVLIPRLGEAITTKNVPPGAVEKVLDLIRNEPE
jgi:3-dehydroquinate synthase